MGYTDYEDEDDVFGGYDMSGIDGMDDSSNSYQEEQLSGFELDTDDENSNKKIDWKRSGTLAGIGAVVIISMLLVARFTGLSRRGTKSNQVQQNSTQVSIDTKTNESQQTIQETVSEITPSTEQSTIFVPNNPLWTEIQADKNVELGKDIDGVFTVTGIKHLARSVGRETIVKTVVTGAISGLGSTFELELPYTLGRYIELGNSFNVSYKLGEINGNILVSDISVLK
jgi:cytoskeletal protein RodZ